MKTALKLFAVGLVYIFLLSACGGDEEAKTALDTTAPTAEVSLPSGTTMSGSGQVVVTFDESMDPASLSIGGDMAGKCDGGMWSTDVNENDTLTISPSGTWIEGAGTLLVNASDLAGNPLVEISLTYTVDATLPTATASPANGAYLESSQSVVITFSEPMAPATLALGGGMAGKSDSGVWDADNITLTISPATTWTDGNRTLLVDASDAAGNPAERIGLVYLVYTVDITTPTVVSNSPAGTDAAVNTAIFVTYDEDIDCSEASLALSNGETSTVACSGATVTFTPVQLTPNTSYTATVSGVTDIAGNMAADHSWGFTTGIEVDTVAPSVVFESPAAGVADVEVYPHLTTLSVTFSEEMDCAMVNGSTFTLTDGTTPVTGTVDCSGTDATFALDANLEFNTAYTATINNTVADLAGNQMVADYQWSFTTTQRVLLSDITFIDSNLQACVAATGATWVDEVTSLSCTFSNITDLSGIEHLKGLIYLLLYSNSITDITPLAGLTGLTDLFLSNNGIITDFTPLFGLTGLKQLALSNTGVTDADLAGIADNLACLTDLFLSNNNLTDFTPLFGLTGLKSLGLGNTGLTDADLAGIAGNLAGLTILTVNSNGLTDITPLSNLTALTFIYLFGNDITDVTPLSNLTALTGLYLNDNRISDISPLSTLTGLTSLYLGGNGITDFTGLSNLTGLLSLGLSSTGLTDADLAGIENLTGLTDLSLGSNGITDISPLSGLTNLLYLYLQNNNITDVTPLSTLTGLTTLDLQNNGITNVTLLSTLTGLTTLGLQNNNITAGVAELKTLTNAVVINLSGNDSIPCADLDTLEAALGIIVVRRPASCAL